MLKMIGGDKTLYTSTRWYKYSANTLIQNIDRISTVFPGRLYIASDDIVDNIAYCKYGCFLLLGELKDLKKKLKSIEDKVKSGNWINKNTASISKLTSENIDIFINNITNIAKLKELSELIHEDIYISYFYISYPNIYLPEPKPPILPPLPRESISIKNTKELKCLIKDTIPYLEVLEKYHMDMYRLVNATNGGLEKILSR